MGGVKAARYFSVGAVAILVHLLARADPPPALDGGVPAPSSRREEAEAQRRQRQVDRAAQNDAAAQADQDRRASATQRRADERDAQQAVDQADRAREQARLQAEEDQQLAPLRAQMGPGFGTATCTDLPRNATPPMTAPFERGVPVVAHDTAMDVAADRADSAQIRASFDALRCYALHRYARPIASFASRAAKDSAAAMGIEILKKSPSYYPTIVQRTVELEPKVRATLSRREAQEAADEVCIAKPGCIEARVVARLGDQLCGLVIQRAEIASQIAKEKANPAGVVDLGKLHEMGSDLQTLDDQIRDIKEAYARTAKHPFNARCQ